MKEENKTFEERFEMLMQSFKESRKEIREMREQSAKEWAEIRANQKETDRQIKETDRQMKETDRQMKETDKKIDKLSENIGGIDRSNGLVAEDTIYNVLEKDKTFCGIRFDYIRKNVVNQSEDHRTLSELDLLMVNGDHIAIIETKYKVENKDITKLLTKQLKDFRACYPRYKNHKIVLGIGGLSFEKNVISKARDNGIGIIKVVGDKLEYHTEEIKIY